MKKVIDMQSKGGTVSIWCDHYLHHAVRHIYFARADLVTLLQWRVEVAGYWQEVEHTLIWVDPEHPKHAQ